MTEKAGEPEESKENPLFPFINKNQNMGSVRELIGHSIGEVDPHNLPEDPEELKKVLEDAVDYAVQLKNPKEKENTTQ